MRRLREWIKRMIDEEREEAKSPFLPTELPDDEMAAVYLRRLKIFGLTTVPGILLFLIVLVVGLIAGRCQ